MHKYDQYSDPFGLSAWGEIPNVDQAYLNHNFHWQRRLKDIAGHLHRLLRVDADVQNIALVRSHGELDIVSLAVAYVVEWQSPDGHVLDGFIAEVEGFDLKEATDAALSKQMFDEWIALPDKAARAYRAGEWGYGRISRIGLTPRLDFQRYRG